MADEPSTSVKTPVCRLSFPTLFKPRAVEEGGKLKYSATLIFDKEAQASAQFKAMKLACAVAVKKKWGDLTADKSAALHNPFIKAEKLKKPMSGVNPGDIIVRVSSEHKPGLVDRRNNVVADETTFYAGCYVLASLNAYAWSNKLKGDGVSLGLNNLQWVKNGEPLGGRMPASADFKPLDDEGEAAEGGDAEALFGDD
jgi:hypothetical protein